jgi:exosortase/archaeosortase family protein
VSSVVQHSSPRRPLNLVGFVRPAIALIVIGVAYATSLRTLVDGLQLDTPLAHLALVPVLSLALAAMTFRSGGEPNIHDRQLDWIVGVPLVTTAILINVLLPARLSTQFWLWRLDLLTMPVFVAGVVTLLFGVRTLWRMRIAVLFLFFAWPVPYSRLLDRFLGNITESTIAALRPLVRIARIAVGLPGGDGSLFSIEHQGTPIILSVASACSGANGMIGFLIVGSAFLFVLKGSRRAKALWLLAGAVLVWSTNLIRIMAVFYVARTWGEKVAIDGFHPFVGLVVFNLAIVVMMMLLGPFRLSLPPSKKRAPGSAPAPAPHRPRLAAASGAVVASSLLLAAFNVNLQAYDLVATSFGSPRLASFAETRVAPPGWRVEQTTQYEGYQRFFGADSTWRRYAFYDNDPTNGGLGSLNGVTSDVIETGSRRALSAYGIESCYAFHGYKVSARQSVDLGGGVVGSVLTWSNPDDGRTWTTLFWHWPIKGATGTRYERTTLIVEDTDDLKLTAPPVDSELTKQLQLSLSDVLTGTDDEAIRERLLDTRTFLVGFGREMVLARSNEQPIDPQPADPQPAALQPAD